VQANGRRHRIWQQVVRTLSQLDPASSETAAATNLVIGLFAAGEFAVEADVDIVLAHWSEARQKISEVRAK
jgi:hypothetical protein